MKNQNTKSSQENDNKISSLRVHPDIHKAISDTVMSLNKKKKGSKKIGHNAYLELAISLMEEKHHEQLLASTVTSHDRQEIAFSNYSKKHKGTTKDDFLELIQYGEIQINDYLPDELKRHKKS